MNIFALSDSPIESAVWQHDRHVVKMILESAQMLSTAIHESHDYAAAFSARFGHDPLVDTQRLYKRTHLNHPCNIWVRESWSNFAWLTLHLNALVGEYHRRFQRTHKTDTIRWTMNHVLLQYIGAARCMFERDETRHIAFNRAVRDLAATHTPFAVCMPDEYRAFGAVKSYRNFYIESKLFQDHVKWTRCATVPAVFFRADNSPRVIQRLAELTIRHSADRREAQSRVDSLTQHPDLLKPANPNAMTRFGTRNPS